MLNAQDALCICVADGLGCVLIARIALDNLTNNALSSLAKLFARFKKGIESLLSNTFLVDDLIKEFLIVNPGGLLTFLWGCEFEAG